MEFTIDIKTLFWIISLVFTIGGTYAYLKFTTKSNTEKSKEQKESLEKFKKYVYDELEKLKNSCDLMIEEDKVKREYVSKEMLDLKFQNLESKVELLTAQNAEILDLVRTQLNGVNK